MVSEGRPGADSETGIDSDRDTDSDRDPRSVGDLLGGVSPNPNPVAPVTAVER